ncbi:hypothetical protein TVAG_040800 [Trichomonas vaginalis G3]|uniref:DUF3447 domain-containing protein n=1 Tax=Trichomonas vaginalis (strain ATCC PRA-98 / G3) TaxID=412133 RepID=A2EWP2_TRIV3|nr:spectrin binding [Trichomonas vaginalis G3]EAY02930.1 hypothetical protein TVAG_040800 [Trichomonas vaginalis G3]KAI5521780.1 spectrin binding [Trichomonas vaginalis G3]|eukprot:XP_001315153.1 hypothetical protein [Trichomonas vaginalis G3]
MLDDVKSFIGYIEANGLDLYQMPVNESCPSINIASCSLLDLCCFYGAVGCYKFLRTKYNFMIGETSLHCAFLGGKPDIMNECLKVIKPDQACMEYAIMSHNIDFVSFLMNEYRLKIDLNWCCKYKNLQAFLVYLDYTQDITNCFLYSPCFNIPALCEYFMSHGFDIRTKNENGSTVMHFASYFNCKDILGFLISHGGKVNEKSNYKKTLLHLAAKNNCMEVIKLLISHGARVNAKDLNRYTPLHYAIENNNKDAVEYLVNHGASLDGKTVSKTALHIAVLNGSIDMVEFLLSLGADINIKDKKGRTVLWIAAQKNSQRLIDFLISRGSNLDVIVNGESLLVYAINHFQDELSNKLIDHHADLSIRDHYGRTALDYAVSFENKVIIEKLLSNGAPVNLQDKSGMTPLHHAIDGRNYELIEILLSHGADITIKNKDKLNPVSYAAKYGPYKMNEFIISHSHHYDKKENKNDPSELPMDEL